MTTTIDLARIAPPDAIEALDYETLLTGFKDRFQASWDAARLIDDTLPEYDVSMLETDPAIILGEAWSYLRLLDRSRVNDGIKALLALLATGSNLDNLVAGQNIERLAIVPATGSTPAVMESDTALLRRYLLSYGLPAAASRDRYLYEAWRVWPQSEDKTLGLWDARVNGFEVHGRRGDTDLVIIGPAGRLPTDLERTTVRDAVTASNIKPEAVSVSVIAATRVEYAVSLVIEVPSTGPAPEVVRDEAIARVTAAATGRILIGGEVPEGLLRGAAYGANVIAVRDLSPVVIASDPFSVPVMTSLTITTEVRP